MFMYCTRCGKQNRDGAKFCTGCGTQLVEANFEENQHVRIHFDSIKDQQTKSQKTKKKPSLLKSLLIWAALVAGGLIAFIVIFGIRDALGTTTPDWVRDVQAVDYDPGLLYDYLSDGEKLFYDAADNVIRGDGSMTGSQSVPGGFSQETALRVQTAYYSDHPEVGDMGVYIDFYYSDDYFRIEKKRDFREDYQEFKPVVDEIVDGLTGTPSEKVLQINDYLSKNIVYDTETEMSWSTYGALINGRAVCQGYSGAFATLCAEAGIPCYCVSGIAEGAGPHGWNIVRLEDGNWYEIDVTGNDNSHSHYYFCVTTSKMNHDHTRTDEQMHGFQEIVPSTQEN